MTAFERTSDVRQAGVLRAGPPPKRHRGVTITELVVSLAVMALLLGLAAPSYRTFVGDNRRAAHTSDLLASLSRARTEAMQRSRIVGLCPSRDGAVCAAAGAGWQVGWILFVNSNGANPGVPDPGDEIIDAASPLAGRVTLRGSGTLANAAWFTPTGTPGAPGTFTWCDARGSSQARAVVLLRSGVAFADSRDALGGALACK